MTARQSIDEVAAAHRQRLTDERSQATRNMRAAYVRVQRSVARDLAALQRRIDAARAAGEPVNVAWLDRQARYAALLTNLTEALNALADATATATVTLVDGALVAAVAHGTEWAHTLNITGGLGVLNPLAAEEIVGVTTYGPLRRLLRERAGEAVTAARDVLREAVMRGWAPSKTAAELRRVTDGAFSNAKTVARTEQLRSYREATRRAYMQNPAVARWQWSSRCLPDRTCPMCWAMHGRQFDVTVPMGTHPNCLCAMVPVVPYVDYGPTGPERFARLTAEQQRNILGPAAYRAYAGGELQLADLVHEHRHPEWGLVRRTGSLTAAVGAERAAQLMRPGAD
ncbi:minor capsid protein [Blastococcus mobilis]|uniref:Phage putative head morphogenesis protein, SPP1 gp7 family n=1 Tax=Blastococcus mobilis TaxID=1938746 RepID=A0A238VW68_9ACTN|nr:minor capsid protein [Blastococcus mobilis]SNR38565.1 phage putative head morphogenesis protein, SPP1 gp7 family [Blastococcus mobilis]